MLTHSRLAGAGGEGYLPNRQAPPRAAPQAFRGALSRRDISRRDGIMQLRNILLAAALVALPAGVNAQPITGWYVGAGVGVNQLLDMNVKGVPGAKITSDVGLAALGSVGYGFGNGIRVELEGNYRNQHGKA